jgi:hypothetical protein
MWLRRRSGLQLTFIRVVHTNDDGSGRDPHLHVFLHVPDAKRRDQLQAALTKVHGYTAAGGLVAHVCVGTDKRVRHEGSPYWGSTFDYITRYQTQQAFVRWWRQNMARISTRRTRPSSRHQVPVCGQALGNLTQHQCESSAELPRAGHRGESRAADCR